MSEESAPVFRLAYVPGVTPAKWVRVWAERIPDVPLELVPVDAADGEAAVRDGTVDAAVLRLPLPREGLSVINLYTEVSVVVVPEEHAVAAVDELSVADLAEETVLHPRDDVLDWARLPERRRSSARPRRRRPCRTSPPRWGCWSCRSRWPGCTTARI